MAERVLLYVVPQEVVEALEAEGYSLTVLKNPQKATACLSAIDLADISMAQKDFPFTFDPQLGIDIAGPYEYLLEATPNINEQLLYRVKECISTAQLQRQAKPEQFTPVYTLNIVDENTWVAVQQRLHNPIADPHLLLSSNQAFFDDLIAQALHTLSFEEVCATNLFMHYLNAAKPTRV